MNQVKRGMRNVTKELLKATEFLIAMNEEAPRIEEDWSNLLRQIELMVKYYSNLCECKIKLFKW